jgi:hypothetical protein
MSINELRDHSAPEPGAVAGPERASGLLCVPPDARAPPGRTPARLAWMFVHNRGVPEVTANRLSMHPPASPLRRALRLALPLLVAAALGGCAAFPGSVLRETRGTLNETAAQTSAEQMLRNIVRLRYGDTPYFLEVSSVSTSATVSANVAASALGTVGLDPTFGASTGLALSQTPSFVFQPLAGEKFAKQMLRPLDLRTLALLRTAGFGLREILLVFADAINGVPNAPAATLYAPREVPDGTSFRRLADLVERLESKGWLQLGVDSTGAPPAAGSDLVLSVSIDRAAVGAAEFEEFARLLDLDPKALTYRVAAAASGGGGRNIALRPRSILAAMRFLSKGVVVPPSDVAAGRVPVLAGEAGAPFDWHRMLGGVIRIGSREDAPADAHVRVRAHERWFYIDAADLASKQTFALLETAYALQAGDVPPVTTILTLPIAR